ncbi:hypothetical protein EST38_g8333 [Candolleomyces aberdarensis]|uniref:Uncharacterized protein n=1 Tax=Candolleomyces aberdarensis TaxID=2316362 RepID=A0A4Q2DEL5_9AGAR|nr:hypothetical protein EST38_g8333 [Candolleomyces aberdarensis]
MEDIDEYSTRLGIPWERAKDVPFGAEVPFVGFWWNLEKRTVGIPAAKREKYLQAIEEWSQSPRHNLEETQKLYGKLLHICHVIPEGRAYLTNLEAFMGLFTDSPFMPRTPPRHTENDLRWWREQLTGTGNTRKIPSQRPIYDIRAFSDASSEVGIGIIIDNRWRAWRLLPGWKAERRDIGWAEAAGFLLLSLTIIKLWPERESDTHFWVFGDNMGVVEGWWKGRSRNWPTNLIFRSVHKLCRQNSIGLHTRYVISKDNPADGPSRGKYGNPDALLPSIEIPAELAPFIANFDEPLTATEQRLLRQGTAPNPRVKPTRDDRQRRAAEALQETEIERAPSDRI